MKSENGINYFNNSNNSKYYLYWLFIPRCQYDVLYGIKTNTINKRTSQNSLRGLNEK